MKETLKLIRELTLAGFCIIAYILMIDILSDEVIEKSLDMLSVGGLLLIIYFATRISISSNYFKDNEDEM